MNSKPLFEICVNGHVSTNSGRERIGNWRQDLERKFASLDLVMLQEKKTISRAKVLALTQKIIRFTKERFG